MTDAGEGDASAALTPHARVPMGPGGEFDLIRAFLGPEEAPAPGVRVGPGDDALVLEDGLVVSCDLSFEDVHFRRSWLSVEEIGFRAAAAALSDLAAVAAEPLGALVSLAVSRSEAETVGPALFAGIHGALAASGGSLLGGDLTASPGPLVLDVVVLGRSDAPCLRDGARPGDELWVTGRLGAAAGAVEAWRGGREPGAGLRAAFARPSARIREALWLAREGDVRALIDLSDGLAGDAGHLAAASGVKVVLEAAGLPVHPGLAAARSPERARDLALRGGEDYELLLASGPGGTGPLVGEFEVRFGVPLTRVGWVEEGEGVYLVAEEGSRALRLEGGAFDHFAPSREGRD